MKNQRTKDALIPFLALLGAAGLIHMMPDIKHPFLITVFFFVITLLYVGLILFWILSVYQRLLPSDTRRYVILAALFMIFLFILRTVNYRITFSSLIRRYCWYGYYISYIMIPSLFLLVSLGIEGGTGNRMRLKKMIVAAISVFLILAVFTNDLHHQVFHPMVKELFIGVTGTYSHGVLFYIVCIWMGAAFASGLFLLLRTSLRISLQKAVLPFLLVCVMIILILLRHYASGKGAGFPYNDPEIICFSMLAIWEACIRKRLISYNKNYQEFFFSMSLPVMITDRDYNVVYRTSAPFSAGKDLLRKTLSEPCYTAPDILLSGKEITGGYAFWEEDESDIHRMEERLQEANELLVQENDLILAEKELEEKKARIESRSRIYSKISEELYPYQKKIDGLLSSAVPRTSGFRETVEKVSLLTAYIKRKTNLLLLSSEKEMVSSYELYLALEESAKYLTCCGIQASAAQMLEKDFPGEALISMYDTFEQIVEQLFSEISQLMISLSGEGIRLLTDSALIPETKDLLCPAETSMEEGLLYITVRFPVHERRDSAV